MEVHSHAVFLPWRRRPAVRQCGENHIGPRARDTTRPNKLSESNRSQPVFHNPRAIDAGFPRRAELPGCTACDGECPIREPVGITRTMVTIHKLRGIQSFGFRAATGPAAAGSSIAVGGEDRILRRSLS